MDSSQANTFSQPRVWYPLPFADRNARSYLVSFRIGEEATWDHRFHELDGREVAAGELRLSAADHRVIQTSCDRAVGSSRVEPASPAANGNDGRQADRAIAQRA
jgi:hypothetical protein